MSKNQQLICLVIMLAVSLEFLCFVHGDDVVKRRRVDGQWGPWGKWSSCLVVCDDGVIMRTRECNNPAPAHGGRNCFGKDFQEVICPSTKRCHLDRDDTDFENKRMGIWFNTRRTDDFDWTLHKGFTPTRDTGTMRDHTTGEGYYLYIESSIPRRPGDKAKLTTPWMPHVPGDGQCIKFAYAMYGKTTGSLSVMIEYKGSHIKPYSIFYKRGNQGKGWKLGKGPINSSPQVPYRLIIEATIGRGTGYSDIAIDDVMIDPGLCGCQDEYTSCIGWAMEGECNKNRIWMNKHCKRSCKQRAKVQSPCTDSDNRCPVWTSRGQCKTSPDYMLVKCVKSCNVCGCHDDDIGCIMWSRKGECLKNPTYMLKNCKRTCKECS